MSSSGVHADASKGRFIHQIHREGRGNTEEAPNLNFGLASFSLDTPGLEKIPRGGNEAAKANVKVLLQIYFSNWIAETQTAPHRALDCRN
jgi:hypothetical protein